MLGPQKNKSYHYKTISTSLISEFPGIKQNVIKLNFKDRPVKERNKLLLGAGKRRKLKKRERFTFAERRNEICRKRKRETEKVRERERERKCEREVSI